VPAALWEHLVLDVRRRDAGVHVQVRGPLDVEEVAVAAVHVDDDGRDLEVLRRDALLGVTQRHGELELA
jgi:hypothetical protein